jgi:hypothetical protein
MPRAALIALLVAGGLLAVGLLAAAFVVAAGSDDEASEADVTLTLGTATFSETFDTAPRRLELPLAANRDALMLARRNGRVLAGLAVVPGERIQAAVVEGEQAVPEAELAFTVDGRRVTPTSCGYACWELDAQQARELVVNAPEPLRFDLPAAPPPSGAQAFAGVTRTMEGLRTYRYDEDLTAGVGRAVTSTWETQVPDRVRIRIGGAPRSVIVGHARWDLRDGRWQRSPFPGLELPSYMWDGAGNARILGRRGDRQVLSVFDREPVPAWFKLTVDGRNRVVDAEMLSPSHFMRQRFRDFDEPLTITPP